MSESLFKVSCILFSEAKMVFHRRKNNLGSNLLSLALGNYHCWEDTLASPPSNGYSAPRSAAHYQHLQFFLLAFLSTSTFPSTKRRKQRWLAPTLIPILYHSYHLTAFSLLRFLTSICPQAGLPFLLPSLNYFFLTASNIFRELHLSSNHLPWPHTLLQSFFHLAWNLK